MKYLEWIDAYIAGTVSPSEKAEFEAALEEIPALQSELAIALKIQHALLTGPQDESIDQLCTIISNRHEQERKTLFHLYKSGGLPVAERNRFEERLKTDELFAFDWESFNHTVPFSVHKGRLYWIRWAAAASVTLFLVILAWWLLPDRISQSEQLFARYDIPELYPKAEFALVNEGLHHRGVIGSKNFNHLKTKGLEAYDAGNWEEAIRLLEAYMKQAKPDDEETADEINLIYLYIGRARLERAETEQAIANFKKAVAGVVDTANYSLLQELMQWQLALAYLKNEDVELAKTVLNTLKNAEQEKIREQAQSLLNELK